MTRRLSEDDIYRTSSQYKLWSFSFQRLADLRRETHSLAIERLRRYEADRGGGDFAGENGNHPEDPKSSDKPAVEYLTEEEELRLVQKYCDQIRATSDHFKWPINVKATAVQYLKRFYLSNSCMTYPPKEIYKTALFLACKSEATHMTLSEYARRISTDPEQVLAPEYKIMQGLRFTLDVKQPFRGLKGILMELLNMAAAKVEYVHNNGTSTADFQREMLALDPPGASDRTLWKSPRTGQMDEKHLNDRVQAAYSAARTLLDAPALLTDAYFLFTPSQIVLAAMQLVDARLTTYYLGTKFSATSTDGAEILTTISRCAEMLASFASDQVLTKDGRAELEKKLERCRDPRTRDLVKAFAALKQDGGESAEILEQKAKRKKLEREKSLKQGEDLFGPSIANTNGSSRPNG